MLTLFQSDGKVVIPPAAAKELSLRTAMPLHVFVEENRLVFQPLNEAYFSSLRGLVSQGGIDLETIREDKLTQRAFEEQKLHRLSVLYPS